MSGRYKDNTFHMLQTFNETQKWQTGFGLTQKIKQEVDYAKSSSGNGAKNMTNFLSQSNYSNWSRNSLKNQSPSFHNNQRHRSNDQHFFRATKDNKNVSRFGYSRLNSMIGNSNAKEHNRLVLKEHLQKLSPLKNQKEEQVNSNKNYLHESKFVKFRATNPLTMEHEKIPNPTNYQKQRMRFLVQKRYPHGMTGIDHPEVASSQFYSQHNSGAQSPIIRVQPNSHDVHEIDKNWKSKGRVSPVYKQEYGFSKGKLIQVRKFNNDNLHGYNIVNNCVLPN